MEAVRLILENAPEKLSIPQNFQHKSVEVIFLPIGNEKKLIQVPDDKWDISNACGILDTPHSVSIEKMDQAIKTKGANL